MTHQLIDGYPCDQATEVKYIPSHHSPLVTQTVLVPGGGCSYYRAMKGDACTFCAFPGFTREVIMGSGNENYFGSWKLETDTYKKMFDHLTKDNEQVERMAVFNGGSFFPDSELPTEFQHHVYQHVANHPNIRQLFVEAYPRFITQRKLEDALIQLKDKELIVGIGFESHNDTVRNVMLKKGIDRQLFEAKIEIMQQLGVRTSIYVFLKAPELTEWQAYQEVINTLNYLSDLGIDEMVLSCAFVPEGTHLEQLYNKGEFRPPWLWTIYNIALQAKAKNWPLIIGGFDDTPPPIAGPSNCPECDPTMLTMLEGIRESGNIPDQIPNCTCKSDWKEDLSDKEPISRIA